MEGLVCGGVAFLIAFVAFSRFRGEKVAGNKTQAIIWFAVSIISGVYAIIYLLSVILQ